MGKVALVPANSRWMEAERLSSVCGASSALAAGWGTKFEGIDEGKGSRVTRRLGSASIIPVDRLSFCNRQRPKCPRYTPAPFRKFPSLAVALNWGIGSSSLKVEVKAFDRLHIARG